MFKVVLIAGLSASLTLLPSLALARPLPAPYRLSESQKKEILRKARARRLLGKNKAAGVRLSDRTFLRVELGSNSLRRNEGRQIQVKYGIKF